MPRLMLTDRYLKGLPAPPSGQVDHWDQLVTGFGLRAASGGARTWVLMIRLKGAKNSTRLALGTYPLLGLAEAREKARAVLRAAQEGRDYRAIIKPPALIPTPVAVAQPVTLRTAWADYEQRCIARHRSPRTIGGYRAHVEKYMAAWLDTPLADLGADRAGVRVLHARMTKDNGASTADGVMRTLRAVYGYAHKVHDGLPPDPTAAADPNRPRRKPVQTLSAAMLPAWWAAVQRLPAVRRDAQLLALLSGIRTGLGGHDEGVGVGIVSLRWDHLDLDGKTLRLPITKTRQAMIVPLSTQMQGIIDRRRAWGAQQKAELAALRAEIGDRAPKTPEAKVLVRLQRAIGSPWLFPSARSRHGHIYALTEQNEDIPGGGGHGYRRAYISLGQAAGVPRETVKRLAGHMPGDVTGLYEDQEAMLPFLRLAQQAISDHIMGAITLDHLVAQCEN